jgi:hypothetical protein
MEYGGRPDIMHSGMRVRQKSGDKPAQDRLQIM